VLPAFVCTDSHSRHGELVAGLKTLLLLQLLQLLPDDIDVVATSSSIASLT